MLHFLDIMIDIETFDNRPSSAVLSIGAVAFDPETDQVNSENGFHQFLKLDEQFAVGRTASESTLLWWLDQGDAARLKQTGANRMPVLSVLRSFEQWLNQVSDGRPDKVRVWGNGAAFDNAILSSLFSSFGMTAPWQFWNDRCYRTLKSLHGSKAEDYGTAHDALDDAIKQSFHLQKIYSTSPWTSRSKEGGK